MDWHIITLRFKDGREWKATVTGLGEAQSIFSRWGRTAHFHGAPLWLSHVVSEMNGQSRIEHCERSFEW